MASELAPDDPLHRLRRDYTLLNNFCLTPYLREVNSWTGTSNPTSPVYRMKVNAQVCKNFPYVKFGKLKMRLSNFIPTINSVSTTNGSTLSTINPAPWMCIAMDTKGAYKKISCDNVELGNPNSTVWKRLMTLNAIPIEHRNNCSQWSHVETLQMGQVWNYEQSFMNDGERWFANPIANDEANLNAANRIVYMLPSNTLPPDPGNSWWQPNYPANYARTYHTATPLPPIALYIPYIGGLDQADNDPQIRGSVTLETSLELHFCSYVEPYLVDSDLMAEDLNVTQVPYVDWNNERYLYFNTFVHQ